jgi:hypothetical protein
MGSVLTFSPASFTFSMVPQGLDVGVIPPVLCTSIRLHLRFLFIDLSFRFTQGIHPGFTSPSRASGPLVFSPVPPLSLCEAKRRLVPFVCAVGDCCRRNKNRNAVVSGRRQPGDTVCPYCLRNPIPFGPIKLICCGISYHPHLDGHGRNLTPRNWAAITRVRVTVARVFETFQVGRGDSSIVCYMDSFTRSLTFPPLIGAAGPVSFIRTSIRGVPATALQGL